MLSMLGYGRLNRLRELRRQICDAIGTGGILLWPVFPTTAPGHGFVWSARGPSAYSAIFNSLGCPAVAIPLGLSDAGLPLCVQAVGRPGEDETALAAAARLEQEFGGWQLAPASSK
jgi:fatty acid amide hydrolase 2